jgi:hypothetical protein
MMRIDAEGQITVPKAIVPVAHQPKISDAELVEHLRGRGNLR